MRAAVCQVRLYIPTRMQGFLAFDKVPAEFLPPPHSGSAVCSPLTHSFACALCQQDELTNGERRKNSAAASRRARERERPPAVRKLRRSRALSERLSLGE